MKWGTGIEVVVKHEVREAHEGIKQTWSIGTSLKYEAIMKYPRGIKVNDWHEVLYLHKSMKKAWSVQNS